MNNLLRGILVIILLILFAIGLFAFSEFIYLFEHGETFGTAIVTSLNSGLDKFLAMIGGTIKIFLKYLLSLIQGVLG